jgi:hypothetical protein
LGNSPTVQVPNGVLQITNQASMLQPVNNDIARVCQGATAPIGAAPSRVPRWLYAIDPFGQPGKIPWC